MRRKPPFPAIAVSALLALLAGCDRPDSGISRDIARAFQLSGGGTVHLAQAVPGPWDDVCVLGPYADNLAARQALGFDWNAEKKTSIHRNEAISLLLFVRNGEVMHYVEHPRADGDFSNLAGRCFPREQSAFVHDPMPARGWPGLVSKAGRQEP